MGDFWAKPVTLSGRHVRLEPLAMEWPTVRTHLDHQLARDRSQP